MIILLIHTNIPFMHMNFEGTPFWLMNVFNISVKIVWETNVEAVQRNEKYMNGFYRRTFVHAHEGKVYEYII